MELKRNKREKLVKKYCIKKKIKNFKKIERLINSFRDDQKIFCEVINESGVRINKIKKDNENLKKQLKESSDSECYYINDQIESNNLGLRIIRELKTNIEKESEAVSKNIDKLNSIVVLSKNTEKTHQ